MPVSDLPWVWEGSNMEISATFTFWMPRILKHNSKTYKKWLVLGWFVHLFPGTMTKAEKKRKYTLDFYWRFLIICLCCTDSNMFFWLSRESKFLEMKWSVRFAEVLNQLQWRQLRRRIKQQLSYCTKRLSGHKKVAINIICRLVWVPQVDKQSLMSICFKIVPMENYLLESDSQLINLKTE